MLNFKFNFVMKWSASFFLLKIYKKQDLIERFNKRLPELECRMEKMDSLLTYFYLKKPITNCFYKNK